MYKRQFTTTIINNQNKVLGTQGVCTVTESNSGTIFNSYSLTSSGGVVKYTKVWNAPRVTNDTNCNSSRQVAIPRHYISGDFNGDGLTDVIAINKFHSVRTCNFDDSNELCEPFDPDTSDDPIPDGCCDCSTSQRKAPNAYFIDVNQQRTTNFSLNIGGLQSRIEGSDRVVASDVDGDGTTEILHFKNGSVAIYSLNALNKLEKIGGRTLASIKTNVPILFGDFNGDGKHDFMLPKQANTSDWIVYTGTGTTFLVNTVYTGLEYKQSYIYQEGKEGERSYEYHYMAQDINNDGRTDLLYHHLDVTSLTERQGFPPKAVVVGYDTTSKVETYVNTPASASAVQFSKSFSRSKKENMFRGGIPVFADFGSYNKQRGYVYLNNNNVKYYQFSKDSKRDVRLNSINNNGITTNVVYAEDDIRTTYYSDTSVSFPFVSIHSLKGVNLVRELTQTGSGVTQTKKFSYRGATTHREGLGFQGFRLVGRTNWHGDGVGTLWTHTKYDIYKRGAVVDEWVSENFQFDASGYISRTQNTYTASLANNKQYKQRIIRSVVEDVLRGVTTTTNYSYDAYNNPIKISSSYPGGSTIKEIRYSNNPSAKNNTYHVGRILEQKEHVTLGSEQFRATQQFSWSNNLTTRKVVKGNGTQQRTTAFKFDRFGNVTEKTFSGNQVNGTDRYTYDSSGRFLIKTTDHLGLETSSAYNTTNGTVTNSTDPYGNTTRFTYDGWQREVTATDYLGKTSTTTYTRLNDGGVKVNVDLPQGADGETITNAFGWTLNTKSLSLNNKYQAISYQYDVAGRATAVSEPYFSTAAPTQWNRSYYDSYGRMISQNLYTGRSITTSYDKLKTTVNDGTKTSSTTTDAVGNVVSITDPGGTINYTYYANGSMKEADYGGHKVTTKIDEWGRKIELNDPSAGLYTYKYNEIGQILEETTPYNGKNAYTYNKNGTLSRLIQTDNESRYDSYYGYDNKWQPNRSSCYCGDNFIEYTTKYDAYGRTIEQYESVDGIADYTNKITYNSYGQVATETYITNSQSYNLESTTRVQNGYDSAGVLRTIRDIDTNVILWEIDEETARGQAKKISLGNGITSVRKYNYYGNLTEVYDFREWTPTNTSIAMHMSYDFDAKRGILKSRNNKMFDRIETFTHDALDRLTGISGAVNQSQYYDTRGLIQNNSELGDYKYKASTKRYQTDKINLNSKGKTHYQKNTLQQITFDGFKRPIKVSEKDKGYIFFEYGSQGNRIASHYGNTEADVEKQFYHKSYSTILPIEIIHDTRNSLTRIITYVGGDAYTAPVTKITNKTATSTKWEGYYYIHRDYLGSILALTNEYASPIRQTHYGAWGTIDQVPKGEEKHLEDYSNWNILGRGFTGHEFFSNMGLIHMNGRMYDPKLRRFLSPDNYIQNPYNTQSFNRYSYVWNNPLTYNDPSGELVNCPDCDNGGGGGLGEVPPGLSNTEQTILGNTIASIFQSLKGARIGRFLATNAASLGQDIGQAAQDVASWIKGVFTAPSTPPTITPIPQNMTSMDVAFISWAEAPQIFNSGGKISFGEYTSLHLGVMKAGFVNKWSGMADLIRNPSKLLRIRSLEERIRDALEMTPMTKPFIQMHDSLMAGLHGPFAQSYYFGGQAGEFSIEVAGLAAGGVGGRALSATSKAASNSLKFLRSGGKTFSQYKSLYWAKRVKPVYQPIRMSNGKVFKVFQELHHRFIPQRAKWAPNWLKNNRFNLQEVNTIRHGILDPYRFRFFPKEIKTAIKNGETFGY